MKKIFGKNKSTVILNPERSEWVSRSHVTSVEIVVNDGVKTKRYSAKRDLYGDFAYAQPLKMTGNSLSLSDASSEPIISAESKKNQPRYSVNCCAISEYDLLLASPKGSLHRHPERSEGSIKNNIKDWILRFANASLRMTIPVLALIFTIATTTESQAASDCAEGEQNCWDCGKTENDLCTARLDTTTKALSVTGSGEMRDYPGMWYDTTKTPWGVDYTSLSVQGVKNIGERAFENTKLTSVSIGDTVTKIGHSGFDANHFLPSITIPDSVTSIDSSAFFNNDSLAKVFIPESVTEVVTVIQNNIEKGPFDRNSRGSTLYCAETTPCYSYLDSNIITYTKDSNGVYKIGNNYFASPDDMLGNSACGSGSFASDECISAAKTYQDQKAKDMAGGALCATKQDCLKLIDRANKKDVCNSIADCAFRENCSKQGNVVYNNECLSEYPFAKKRWTPAEANEWLHDGNDNFVIITFKK